MAENLQSEPYEAGPLKPDSPACKDCGTTEDVELMEDPFASDMWDDHTLVYLCSKCAYESAMSI